MKVDVYFINRAESDSTVNISVVSVLGQVFSTFHVVSLPSPSRVVIDCLCNATPREGCIDLLRLSL